MIPLYQHSIITPETGNNLVILSEVSNLTTKFYSWIVILIESDPWRVGSTLVCVGTYDFCSTRESRPGPEDGESLGVVTVTIDTQDTGRGVEGKTKVESS